MATSSNAVPRVSVVTVSLNNRIFIADTIRSVFAQDHPNIEYVIIDGGSTDGTVEVIRAHEARLAAWVSEPDNGISDAFNKGLARTSGDYILFLNSDDWLAGPEVVSGAMQVAVNAGCPEVVFGDCDVVDRETSRRLRRLSMKWSPLAFRMGRMINHPALFTHRSYFDRYGTFDTSYRIAMDFELLLRGALKVRVVHFPGVVTNMRSGGLSTRDRERVVGEIVRALKKNGVIRTRWGERCIYGYFALRRMLQPLRAHAARNLRRG
jgi:glycosyltransferase involved in cell wall biosynthesis